MVDVDARIAEIEAWGAQLAKDVLWLLAVLKEQAGQIEQLQRDAELAAARGLNAARELAILREAMHRIAEHPNTVGLIARRALGLVAALEFEETRAARERGG